MGGAAARRSGGGMTTSSASGRGMGVGVGVGVGVGGSTGAEVVGGFGVNGINEAGLGMMGSDDGDDDLELAISLSLQVGSALFTQYCRFRRIFDEFIAEFSTTYISIFVCADQFQNLTREYVTP